MSDDAIRELAGRLTLGEFVRLAGLVIAEAWPGVEYAGLVGHVGEGVPDLWMPVVTQRSTLRLESESL